MIELILSVCMITQPQSCRNVHLTYAADRLTANQCMMAAQPQVAEWLTTHPRWQVRRWRCGMVGDAGHEI